MSWLLHTNNVQSFAYDDRRLFLRQLDIIICRSWSRDQRDIVICCYYNSVSPPDHGRVPHCADAV